MKRDQIIIMALLILALVLILNSCGGGGASSPPGTPFIAAELNSFPTDSVPQGFNNDAAFVSVVDSSSGSAITNATAIINGVTLLYNGTDQQYEGNVVVSSGNPITLSVTVSGSTYTASTTQYSSCPAISSPAPNATWSVSNSNTVKWSGGTPTTPNGLYGLGVLDANNPNGNLVWPTGNSLQGVSIGSTSWPIPANSLTAGSRFVIVGIATVAPISGAAGGSRFIVAGFSYVPLTVTNTPAPTNVTAVPGNSSATISWTAVPGATSYNIYWSTTAANATMQSGSKIANITSPYVHMGLTNGTTYYYVVTAVGPGGESQESSQVVSVIPGFAGIPKNIIAIPENGQVYISWNAVTNATSYNIYWSTTAANANKASGIQITGIGGTHDVQTGLTNGTPYYYVVTAIDPYYGESVESSPVATAIPGAAVTAASGNGQVTISWTAVSGGTSYNIYWSTTPADATIQLGTKIANVTNPYVHTGLTNGMAYYYLVTVITSNGEIAVSSLVASRPGTLLMGGAVQGFPLSLSKTVTTIAGQDSGCGSIDGAGSAAFFCGATGVTTDGTNIYVSDSFNHTIRMIVISTGVVTTLAGSPSVSGSADGTGPTARFYYPTGITTDGTNLYVVDFNQTIRKIVISTGVVTTLAGTTGQSGSADGTGTAARFNFPYLGGGYYADITTDGNNLFVTDTANNTIRKIAISTGVVTTLAGTAGQFGSADNTGPAARFYNPTGITTDGINLYVADALNNSIRQIVISTGVVTTLAGTASNFYRPQGITTDGTNLYVADELNDIIRKIVISTGVVSTLIPQSSFYFPQGIVTDGIDLFVTYTSVVNKIQ